VPLIGSWKERLDVMDSGSANSYLISLIPQQKKKKPNSNSRIDATNSLLSVNWDKDRHPVQGIIAARRTGNHQTRHFYTVRNSAAFVTLHGTAVVSQVYDRRLTCEARVTFVPPNAEY
jgi:hypothetical protein